MKITELKMETFLKMCNSGEIAHNSDNENWVNELIQIGYDFCKKEYEEKLRWTRVEENLPPLKAWVICKHEEIYDTQFFDNEFQMAGCIKRFLIIEWRFFL